MTAIIIIPARFGSTRLAGKLLLDATGKPLIQHTYEAAQKSDACDIIIATDDQRIKSVTESFGARTVMTSVHHTSGTARIAEAALALKACNSSEPEVIVNLQGDEPEVDPEHINTLIRLHIAHKTQFFASTLACPFASLPKTGPGSPLDPACVKVVATQIAKEDTPADSPTPFEARYFSRALIPYPRDVEGAVLDPSTYLLHLGIYAFTPDSLAGFAQLPESPLERAEKLEQLRILDHGHRLGVALVNSSAPGIDTPEDYAAFVRRVSPIR